MDRVKMVLPEILQDSPRFHGKNPWFAALISPTSSSLVVNRKDRVLGPRKRGGSGARKFLQCWLENHKCPMKVAIELRDIPSGNLT